MITDAYVGGALGMEQAIRPSGVAPSGFKRLRWVRRHWRLYAMLSVPLVFLLLFSYLPLVGAQIAFRDYNPVQGIWGSPWVGLAQFRARGLTTPSSGR